MDFNCLVPHIRLSVPAISSLVYHGASVVFIGSPVYYSMSPVLSINISLLSHCQRNENVLSVPTEYKRLIQC